MENEENKVKQQTKCHFWDSWEKKKKTVEWNFFFLPYGTLHTFGTISGAGLVTPQESSKLKEEPISGLEQGSRNETKHTGKFSTLPDL